MTTEQVLAIEYVCISGTSAKYWRIFTIGNIVATHYGRIGAKGAITVHHCGSARSAEAKAGTLVASKSRKGYQETILVRYDFPTEILAKMASTNYRTGNGGENPHLAWAFVAFLHATFGRTTEAENPMGDYVHTYEEAEKIALGALSGMAPSPHLLTYETEDLRVLAGLTSVGPVPTFA